MEVADPSCVGDPPDVVDRAIVAMGYLIGVFNDLIDEVSKVQDKAKLAAGGRALVLPDHPAVGVLCALVNALARHEGEADRPVVVKGRSGDRAADSAAAPLGIGEAIPVSSRGTQATDENAGSPVRFEQHGCVHSSDDTAELRIKRDLDAEVVPDATCKWSAGPKQDAMLVRITRCDALWIEVASLLPAGRCRGVDTTPGKSRTQTRRDEQKPAAVDSHRISPKRRLICGAQQKPWH